MPEGIYILDFYTRVFISVQLFAFERDRKRFTTLKNMLSKAGCKNTEAINADFTSIEPTDPKYVDVTHMYAILYIVSSIVLSITAILVSSTRLVVGLESSIGWTTFLIQVCRLSIHADPIFILSTQRRRRMKTVTIVSTNYLPFNLR